jgi:ADP-ribosylglycohydrolase
MIGAVIGDVVGSRFEGFSKKQEKPPEGFELFHNDSRFTDDTILTCCVADCLLRDDMDFHTNLQKFYHKYPTRGFGGRFAEWANECSQDKIESYGNGSVMRISPVGFSGVELVEIMDLAQKASEPSHNHVDAILGAQAGAVVVFFLKDGMSMESLPLMIKNLFNLEIPDYKELIDNAPQFDITAKGTFQKSLSCFLASENFEDAIRKAVMIGGDTDTNASIVGAFSQAHYGVPEEMEKIVREKYLDEELTKIIDNFYSKFGTCQFI